MNKLMIAAGALAFVLALVLAQADGISSSISSTGHTFVSSSIEQPDRAYSLTVFTVRPSVVSRELDTGGDRIDSRTLVHGSGPVGIDEFSGQVRNQSSRSVICSFLPGSTEEQYDEIIASGLLESGEYLSYRQMSDLTGARTMINGSGMMMLNKKSETNNSTQKERVFVSGRMNVSEAVDFGDGVWI